MAKKITIGMRGKIVLVSVISIVLLVGITILSSCNTVKRSAPEQYLNDYVNVFAGNATVGHTSPCATTPFGMVKVGPESGLTS
ncbi:MAG: hypothetical protein Q4F54_03130 [Coriobacteriia bacterium]|nr:hypothetical protein [Coriobacteriia bacterium]